MCDAPDRARGDAGEIGLRLLPVSNRLFVGEDEVRGSESLRNARPGYHCFVHRSRIPLREVVFEASAPHTMALFENMDMSQSGGCEEGYCGL
jgi:hypothetical protein